MEIANDILKTAIGWAVPLLLAWLLTRIPRVRKWFTEHPNLKIVALSSLMSVLIGATAVLVYNRYVNAPAHAALQAQIAQMRSELEAQIGQMQKVLYDASDTPVAQSGNKCPDGSYAFGVDSKSVTGGNAGYLESVTINCKPLRFARPK